MILSLSVGMNRAGLDLKLTVAYHSLITSLVDTHGPAKWAKTVGEVPCEDITNSQIKLNPSSDCGNLAIIQIYRVPSSLEDMSNQSVE